MGSLFVSNQVVDVWNRLTNDEVNVDSIGKFIVI